MSLARELIPPDVLTTVDAAGLKDRSACETGGLLVARQRPETANGVIFLLIEDETGTLNLVVPPPAASKYRLTIRSATLLRARGRIETNQGVVNLLVNHMTEIRPPDPSIKALAPTGFNFGRRGR